MTKVIGVGWAERPFVLELRKEITNIEKSHPGADLVGAEGQAGVWSRLFVQAKAKTRRQASGSAPATMPSGLFLRPELGLEHHLEAVLGDGPFTARRGRIWLLPVLCLRPGVEGHDGLLDLDEYGFARAHGVTAVSTEEMRLAGEVAFIPESGGEGLMQLARKLGEDDRSPWRWALLEWFGPDSGGFWTYDQLADLHDLRDVGLLLSGSAGLDQVLGESVTKRISKHVELSRGMDRV